MELTKTNENLFESLKADIETKISLLPISESDFSIWSESRVTQRLMAEINLMLLEFYQENRVDFGSANRTALESASIKGAVSVINEIIDWNPTEE